MFIRIIVGCTIAVSFFFSSATFGQECEELLNEKVWNIYDSKRVETNWIELEKDVAYFKLSLENKKLDLILSNNLESTKGRYSQLQLKFANGDLFTVVSMQSGSNIFTRTDGIGTKYKNRFSCDLLLIEKLLTSQITGITSMGALEDIDFKPSSSNMTQYASKCFMGQIDTLVDIQPFYLLRDTSLCNFFTYEEDLISGNLRKRLPYSTIGFKGQPNDYNSLALVGSLFQFEGKNGLDIRLNSLNYCVTNDSKLIIKLINDSVITLENISGINCGEGSELRCLLDNQLANALKSADVKAVRLVTGDGFMDVTNVTMPDYFKQQLGCLEK